MNLRIHNKDMYAACFFLISKVKIIIFRLLPISTVAIASLFIIYDYSTPLVPYDRIEENVMKKGSN